MSPKCNHTYFLFIIFVLIAGSCNVANSEDCYNATGIASWYGEDYHGSKTASGEIYDMESLTAAHKTLPFDTMVLVENLENGKSVTVRINNRGPFVSGRVIDLSRKGAREIDIITSGLAEVELHVINQEESSPKLKRCSNFSPYFKNKSD